MAFLPKGITVTFLPAKWVLISTMVAFKILELKAPQRPLSEVTGMTSTFLTSLSLANSISKLPSIPEDILLSIAVNFCEYGRIWIILSWALRSLEAATIFIALVICWVELTEFILSFTSFKLAMFFSKQIRYPLMKP